MWRVYGGAILIIAGIVALIEARSHHPEPRHAPLHLSGENVLGTLTLTSNRSAWSQTAYDLVRIGGWALLILGLAAVVIVLIRYAQRPRGTA
jgi:hypothetical protein